MESQDVDPAVRSALDELDLSCCQPSRGLQAALHKRYALSMSGIPLPTTVDDERRPNGEADLDVEGVADRRDRVDRDVDGPGFDPGDHCAPHIRPLRDPFLGPAQIPSRPRDRGTEGLAE
jgi:hypothetical protein